ncbi:venom acid phosphatase Acph-1-like [Nasonia vitripennis]|uniref:acid phosphatase n=1 Tax=Nasonia vitripennis TaxID=7425 RepID=A0A7M7M657_NASVI|nr:venom acid phosphatase Acph-1-like [Nasonia vitripennis]
MFSNTYLFNIFTVLFVCMISNFATADNFTLKSISVLFRHGDRTPEKSALYPTDPHVNEDFHPVSFGGLTNVGKKREYELGKFLRNRYNDFLRDVYNPGDVYARSSDYSRTKMSLLLVLAGLYPPNKDQRWTSKLNWQPIPITYMPIMKDSLLRPLRCPTFGKEHARVLQTKEYTKDFARFGDDLIKLSKFTGLNITKARQVLSLYNTLTAEAGLNLALPEWTKPYFPQGVILDVAIFDLKTLTYNTKLTRLNGGMLLRKFLDDASAVQQGRRGPNIFLYSAHEVTVSALLWALKVSKSEIPEYSSSVILELWEKDSEYYVKVVYYKGVPSESEDRTIQGCFEFCPLEDFKNILRDHIPDDVDRECFE